MTIDEVRLATAWAIKNDVTWLMQRIPYEMAEAILDHRDQLRDPAERELKPDGPKVPIDINRARFYVPSGRYTGQQIRDIPKPSIDHDYDIWRPRLNADDERIEDEGMYEVNAGSVFWTAPRVINAGASNGNRANDEG